MSLFYNHVSQHSGKYSQDSQTSQLEAKLQKCVKNLHVFNILISPCFQSFFCFSVTAGFLLCLAGFFALSSDSWEIFHATVPVVPVTQVTILRLDYTSV